MLLKLPLKLQLKTRLRALCLLQCMGWMVAVLGVLVVGTSLIWREQSEPVNLRITFSGMDGCCIGRIGGWYEPNMA